MSRSQERITFNRFLISNPSSLEFHVRFNQHYIYKFFIDSSVESDSFTSIGSLSCNSSHSNRWFNRFKFFSSTRERRLPAAHDNKTYLRHCLRFFHSKYSIPFSNLFFFSFDGIKKNRIIINFLDIYIWKGNCRNSGGTSSTCTDTYTVSIIDTDFLCKH